MIKILHVMAAADSGGIERVVLNYIKRLDPDLFDFEIAITKDSIGLVGKELISLGLTIHKLPLKSSGIRTYLSVLRHLLERNHYDVLHVHDNSTSYLSLCVGKLMGIPIRIAHSHTAVLINGIIPTLRWWSGKVFNPLFSTHLIGCGQLAAFRVFGRSKFSERKTVILPNGIDTSKFEYNSLIREEVRAELGLNNKFVIGFVGRMENEKNPSFAISVFNEVIRAHPNAMLVFIGTGSLREKLELLASLPETKGRVLFLGERGDVSRVLQAFDVLLMPSYYEGFPVVALEAAASGLPIILSDTITDELSFVSEINYMSLDSSPSEWSKALLDYKNDDERNQRGSEVKENGYDISETASRLRDIYITQIKGKDK